MRRVPRRHRCRAHQRGGRRFIEITASAGGRGRHHGDPMHRRLRGRELDPLPPPGGGRVFRHWVAAKQSWARLPPAPSLTHLGTLAPVLGRRLRLNRPCGDLMRRDRGCPSPAALVTIRIRGRSSADGSRTAGTRRRRRRHRCSFALRRIRFDQVGESSQPKPAEPAQPGQHRSAARSPVARGCRERARDRGDRRPALASRRVVSAAPAGATP